MLLSCCCKFGGMQVTVRGVEFDERSTETEGEGELNIVAILGGDGRWVA